MHGAWRDDSLSTQRAFWTGQPALRRIRDAPDPAFA